MEGYIAETRMFGGNFPPRGWAFCQGQVLSIAQNTALFALIGVIYGGNGQTTFALPDLRGRAPIGPTNQYPQGSLVGTETITLLTNNLPAHNHTIAGTIQMPASGTTVDAVPPVGNFFGNDGSGRYDPKSDGVSLAEASVGLSAAPVPGNQEITNMMPYTAVHYIICMEGIFPSRN